MTLPLPSDSTHYITSHHPVVIIPYLSPYHPLIPTVDTTVHLYYYFFTVLLKDKYDSPPMDKYHQPVLQPLAHGRGHTDDTTNEHTLHDGNHRLIRPHDHHEENNNNNDDDDVDDGCGSSVWRDAGGLYAHIPSRLHCPTTGSVHGRRDLDQEKAQAMALEMEKQRSIERATHAPTLGR